MIMCVSLIFIAEGGKSQHLVPSQAVSLP